MTTVADLISADSCTAACIAATTSARRCTCPCAGIHHGLLALASIDSLLEARSSGLTHLSDLEVIDHA